MPGPWQASSQINIINPFLAPCPCPLPPCSHSRLPVSRLHLVPPLLVPKTSLACPDAWKNYTCSQKTGGRAEKCDNQIPISSFGALLSRLDGWRVSWALNPEGPLPPSALRAASTARRAGAGGGAQAQRWLTLATCSRSFRRAVGAPPLAPKAKWTPGCLGEQYGQPRTQPTEF